MAWAQCAFSFFPPSSANKTIIITRKTLASLSPRSPSKLTKRKNHLRPKLLKSLTKPHPFLLPQVDSPLNLSETLEIVQEQQLEIYPDRNLGEISSGIVRELEEEIDEHELDSHGLRVSETAGAGVSDALGVITPRSVLKFGFYFVGFFVFQTICAVWILASIDPGQESRNGEGEDELRVSELEVENEKRKEDFSLNRSSKNFGNFVGSKPGGEIYVDKYQFEEKVVEIRAMARKVRESEAKKLKDKDLVSSSEVIGNDGDEVENRTSNSVVKTNIQKEVDGRLIKLQKRLNSLREKLPMLSINYLSSSDKVKDRKDSEGSEAKEKNRKLVFKKKRKFQNYPASNESKPKGFNGLTDDSGSDENNRKTATKDPSLIGGSSYSNGLDLASREKQVDLPHTDSQEIISMAMEKERNHRLSDEASGKTVPKVLKNEKVRKESFGNELSSFQAVGKKLGNELESSRKEMGMGVKNTGTITDGIQEAHCGRHLGGSVEPRESTELKAQNFQGFTKESQDTSTIPYKLAPLTANGSSVLPLQTKEREHGLMVNNVRSKQSDVESDLWWQNLPYALAILMRRGSDREGPGGLYSLKISSHPQEENCLSYTVTFEDRSDATNFCYLLESFFEDMGDFSANIVPLSIKELDEAVKSDEMKVIVVRKGQLQLYAGQPLADVEMALRSFVK